MTRRQVAVDPVKAILATPDRHKAAPVSPRPVIRESTGCSGTTCPNASTSQAPMLGVYSDGLKTTAFPAAKAYAIDPMGVNTG